MMITRLSQVALGLVLVMAGAAKWFAPTDGVRAIEVVGERVLPGVSAYVVMRSLVFVELVVGAFLLVGAFGRAPLMVAALLCGVFVVFVVLLDQMQPGTPCGCGVVSDSGDAVWGHVLRNTVLCAIAFAGVLKSRSQQSGRPRTLEAS